MSPETGWRRYTHTHLKWFMGKLVFIRTWSGLWGHKYLVHHIVETFHFFFFLFYFLRVLKKHKNANKRISHFLPLRCFLSTFLIFVRLFAFCAFARLYFCVFWCFLCFLSFLCSWRFWCFWCVQNLFVKKNKKFKTNLIHITTH